MKVADEAEPDLWKDDEKIEQKSKLPDLSEIKI